MMDAIMAAKFRGVSSWSEICASREKAMRAYDEWNTYVKTVVPAKKLLVFNPKEGHGYKELATFLGVDGETKRGVNALEIIPGLTASTAPPRHPATPLPLGHPGPPPLPPHPNPHQSPRSSSHT